MEKHLKKMHKDKQDSLNRETQLSATNRSRHNKIAAKKVGKNQMLPKAPASSESESELDIRAASVIQSDRETIFGDKHLGPWAHESDGKFGSISLYDDYGDEANAD